MGSNISFEGIDEIRKEYSNHKSDTLLIVVDKKVYELYKSKIDFENFVEDKRVVVWVAPEGELTKSHDQYIECMEFFLSKGIHRNSHMIAIGGGATSDFAGFVAATALRGISWSVIPTTLLSMVDAAIGGKVAINSEYGKNLIGAFHLPSDVRIDLEFLETLSSNQFLSGTGEIIKYGLLDRIIFNALQRDPGHRQLISQCIEYKARIADADLHEGGVRKLLNLGHTMGHAFEVAWNYPHGVAVVLGIDFILRLYEYNAPLQKLHDICTKMGIANLESLYKKGADIDQLIKLVTKDKKIVDKDSIELIVIKDIGYHAIETVKRDEFIERARRVLGAVCSK